MNFPTRDLVSLLVIFSLLTAGQASAYPSYVLHQQRKADPFVALANTLRQEQEQEALQQQQQRGVPSLTNGYYYDYGRPEEGPSDDDLYQMAQLQRQLSRAAVAPFFGRVQRGGWGTVVDTDQEEYGYPVETEAADQWYDNASDGDRQAALYDEEELAREQQQQRQRQEQQEGQLLLDMLTEYMMMYNQAEAADEAKRASSSSSGGRGATVEAGKVSRDEIPPAPSVANVTEVAAGRKSGQSEAMTVAPMTTTTMTAIRQEERKDKQPPVRKSPNGTPLGQQEFPMMRPATPQRNQWLVNQILESHNNNNNNNKDMFPLSGLDTNKKRHYDHGKNLAKKSAIRTPQDELIEELDNLKMKKN